jgi:hypothetical protein
MALAKYRFDENSLRENRRPTMSARRWLAQSLLPISPSSPVFSAFVKLGLLEPVIGYLKQHGK